MSKNQNIFSGQADAVLYDSTNGYLYLGHNAGAKVISKPVYKRTIEHQYKKVRDEISAEIRFLDISENMRSAINARSGIAQKVYLTGTESAVVLEDIFCILRTEYNFNRKVSENVLTGGINDPSKVTHYINLLGTEGQFETGSGGIATGWNEHLLDEYAIEASFLADSGNAQSIGFNNIETDAYFANGNNVFPFKSQRKITFSAYVKNSDNKSATFRMFIFAYDIDEVYTSHYETFTLAPGEIQRLSAVMNISPTKLIYKLQVYFDNTTSDNDISLVIDNAQLEFGKLSNFKNY